MPIPASDQTWLHMDRPNNLMYVRSLMWFDEAPDMDRVREVLRERVVGRHPVFHRHAVQRDGHWYWEADEGFDLDRHVRPVTLDGTAEDLRTWLGEQFAEPFDPDGPLWSMDLITGVEGYGALLFCRFHHALADGIRLTQLLFSMCDVAGDAATTPTVVGRGDPAAGLLATGAHAVAQGASDAADFVTGALRAPLRAVAALRPDFLEQGLSLVLHPSRLFDVVEALASGDNQSVNTVTEVSRLLAAPHSVTTAWSGTPGIAKGVAWVSGLDLGRIKEVGREHGGTVNDVLLALVSRAFTRYLEDKDALVDQIAWLVPVSLLPFDANLPEELGNHFSLVFLPMPLGVPRVHDAIAAMRSRMERIKHSVEPVITFGVQRVIAESPKAIAFRITNLFANKSVGILTNVPGPREPVTFAGVPLSGVLGWVPTSGDQPLGVCIFSYNNSVSIGIAADAGLVPDPERIAALIDEEFAAL